MTKCKVVGIEDVKFTDKETGVLVNGRRVHCTYDLPNKDGIQGIGAIQAFLFVDEVFMVEIGDIVVFSYGSNKKPNDILILDK